MPNLEESPQFRHHQTTQQSQALQCAHLRPNYPTRQASATGHSIGASGLVWPLRWSWQFFSEPTPSENQEGSVECHSLRSNVAGAAASTHLVPVVRRLMPGHRIDRSRHRVTGLRTVLPPLPRRIQVLPRGILGRWYAKERLDLEVQVGSWFY